MKLWLDDERPMPEYYDKKVTNIEEAKELILNDNIELVSIDNDLGTGNEEGYKLIDWIEEQVMEGNIGCMEMRTHSANPVRRHYINKVIGKIYRHCKYKIEEYSWDALRNNFPLFCDFIEECYSEYNDESLLVINFDEGFYDLINTEFGIDLRHGFIWRKLEDIEEMLNQRFEKE